MPTLKFLLIPLALAAIVRFIAVSSRRQQIAVLLAWLVPGLGHVYIGRTRRGVFLAAIVVAMFIAGMIMSDFRNISPFDRHPIWGIAQIPGGLMTGIAAALTNGLLIERDLPFYSVGCLYSSVATLLNILLMIDVYDHAEKDDIETAGATA